MRLVGWDVLAVVGSIVVVGTFAIIHVLKSCPFLRWRLRRGQR